MSTLANIFHSIPLPFVSTLLSFVNVFVFFILMDSLFLLHYCLQAFESSGETKGAKRFFRWNSSSSSEILRLVLRVISFRRLVPNTHISSQTVIFHFEAHFICFSTLCDTIAEDICTEKVNF